MAVLDLPASPEVLERYIRAALACRRRMFRPFPEISDADLIQHAFMTICQAQATPGRAYDPARVLLQTWVSRIVTGRWLDLWKRLARAKRRHERAAVECTGVSADEPTEAERAEPDPAVDLLDWTSQTYRTIRRNAAVYLGTTPNAGARPISRPPRRWL